MQSSQDYLNRYIIIIILYLSFVLVVTSFDN